MVKQKQPTVKQATRRLLDQTQAALQQVQQYDQFARGGCEVWSPEPGQVIVQHRFDNYKSWAAADTDRREQGEAQLRRYQQILDDVGFTVEYEQGVIIPRIVVLSGPMLQEELL